MKNFVQTFLIFCLLFTIAGRKRERPERNPGKDCVLCMTFNEGPGARDWSGKGNHGTISGATYKHDDGMVSGCYYFDGVNDVITSQNNLGISGSQNRTISLWVKRYSTSTSYRPWGWGVSAEYNLFDLLLVNTGDKVQIAIHTGNRIWNYSWDTNWHHLVIVLNGTNTSNLTAFIDRVALTVSSTNDQTINTIDSTIKIGYGDANYMKGRLDEIQIFNRALSLAEIKQLYEQGKAAHE